MSETSTRLRTTVKDRLDHDAAEAQANGTTSAPEGTPENPSSKVLTIANLITFFRLLLTLAFLYLFVSRGNRYLALSFYGIAAITDFLDGQVARRTQTVSWVGKVMDPIMDRVLLFTGVLGLMITGELPVWVAVFVVGRDSYLAVGSALLQRYQHRPVDVVYVGKAATALLMAGFCDLLLNVPQLPALSLVNVSWLPGLNTQSAALGIYLVYVGIVLSAATAVIYTRTGLAIRRRVRAERSGRGDK